MIDLEDIQFKLRKGVEWEEQPYRNLIETLCSLGWVDRNFQEFTIAEIEALTSACYEKWGDNRRDYFTALEVFLEKYHTLVREDCMLFRNDCDIISPGLKNFRVFVQQVVEVVMEPQYKSTVSEYVNDSSYTIPSMIRRAMAEKMLVNANKNVQQEYDSTFRKLSRLLLDHREPMCQIFSAMNEAMATTDDNGLHQERAVVLLGNRVEERRTSRLIDLEAQRNLMREIEMKIENAIETDFLKVRVSRSVGYGVIATRNFEAKEFLMEYAGDLMDRKEGKKMHEKYSQDETIGSYIFDFTFGTKSYSIDATADRGRLGRFINHSKKNPNAKMKAMYICNQPRLLIFALNDIKSGEELLYDYGDRNINNLQNHPWLKK